MSQLKSDYSEAVNVLGTHLDEVTINKVTTNRLPLTKVMYMYNVFCVRQVTTLTARLYSCDFLFLHLA